MYRYLVIAIMCSVLLFACKKVNEDKESPTQSSQEATDDPIWAARGYDINPSCGRTLYQKIDSLNNNIDTLDLMKDSSIVYYVDGSTDEHRGEPIVIYKIPFDDNTSAEPHFLLVATNIAETKFRGNEIRINPTTDFRTTGVFDGSVECTSIDTTVGETISFSQSIRTTYYTGGKHSVAPVSMPSMGVPTLPEVIVVGYIHNSTPSYGMWINLLNMVGITAGEGGWGGTWISSGGGGGGSSSGNPYGYGYYGQASGPNVGNEIGGTPTGGQTPPNPVQNCTMPIQLPYFIGNDDEENNNSTPFLEIDTLNFTAVTDACYLTALSKVADTSIRTYIANLVRVGFTDPNHQMNLVFREDNTIQNAAESYAQPPNWVILMNTASTSQANISQEYMGALVLHEIIHCFVYLELLNRGIDSLTDFGMHRRMFRDYVTHTRDHLMAVFGISKKDATALALGGIDDVLEKAFTPNGDWDVLTSFSLEMNAFAQSHYGMSIPEADAIAEQYANGLKGLPCN